MVRDADGRLLICNPTSGSGDHVDRVVELAGEHGFAVRRTEGEGHARELARKGAADVDLVGAAGGDGTINEVVNGLVEANALEDTALGVVPGGTGNNFASNVGIEGVEYAFEVIEDGERRALDLGVTNERAFVNSCVCGITAEASGATSSEEKERLGILAYLLKGIEQVSEFDALPLRVELGGDEQRPVRWEGEAMFVLVGNCRRFTTARRAQADVEDGEFEVAIIEQASASDLAGEATFGGLFGDDGNDAIVRQRAPSLSIEHRDGEAVEYSLDGEMLAAEELELRTHDRALTVAVGEGYRPDPDADREGLGISGDGDVL